MCNIFQPVEKVGQGIGDVLQGARDLVVPKVPEVPEVAAPSAPPGPAPTAQAGKTPEQDRRKALTAASSLAGGGRQSTMLTGPGGVAPSLLNLGKNKLLGS